MKNNVNLIDFGLRINSPPYITNLIKLLLSKHEKIWDERFYPKTIRKNELKILKIKKMKKKILLLLFFIGFLMHGFAQQALINGVNNPPNENVCDGGTYSMTGDIDVGVVDSREWYLSENGAPYVLVSTAATIDAPVGGVVVGDTYDYVLRVYYDGTGTFVSTSISLIPTALPTIGDITTDVPCETDDMTIDIDGLGNTFPVNVEVYFDGTNPGDLIHTEPNVNTATISFTITPVWVGTRDLYYKVINPVTGCVIWK